VILSTTNFGLELDNIAVGDLSLAGVSCDEVVLSTTNFGLQLDNIAFGDPPAVVSEPAQ
jgi:hypothetical protein